ncbi:nuclear transport factor 2 family protein [Salegentibacter sediminis]|uniref:nuclear transport factor 2 family protein n=1 Tax=Salegentibacter sediminis TaxID=1930251 RepID=UPI0009BDB1F7|nr:nuclear transport factor 2 family protein [Salegentibacter sediminis]
MALSGKEIVENFYTSDFYQDKEVLREFLHPQVELSWYGTTGLKTLNLDEISDISHHLAHSFESLRAEVENVISENGKTAIQFTYHVRTIENPEEEMPLAHFMAIWELKDDKLYRGVQISQLGEEVSEQAWL